MMLVGEVHTGMLRSSTALTAGAAAALLGFRPGQAARYGERPVRFAQSPELLTGVDCALASTMATPRGIGTISSRASILGGHILLSSSSAVLAPAEVSRRLPWSSYLARPGVIDVLGRMQPEALGTGFLGAATPPSTLDMGAINTRIFKEVQAQPSLDARPAFRSQVTRLRWVALPTHDQTSAVFTLQRNGSRTIELRTDWEEPAELVAFCEDLALHDWLLSTLVKLLDHSNIGAAPRREVIARLNPAMDFLLHLWMPGVRLSERAKAIWLGLEERAGLSRQWHASVDRVRDQFSLAAISRLLGNHSSDHS